MSGDRFSLRLPDYDYRFGAFFVTLVTAGRLPLFGHIQNGAVILSPEGRIVEEEWLKTPSIRPSVQLDEFVIMPDHFHAIVFIDNRDDMRVVGGASSRPCQINDETNRGIEDNTERIKSIQPARHSLARMINQFKATVTHCINESRGTRCLPIWQRNYNDRIIRNEVELDKLRKYIRNNPAEYGK